MTLAFGGTPAVGSSNSEEERMAQAAQVVVLEARRNGRRPRYHRGAILPGGAAARPEQCNLDQVGVAVRELADGEAVEMKRPWAQLCRRCWRGTPELAAALAARPQPENSEVPY